MFPGYLLYLLYPIYYTEQMWLEAEENHCYLMNFMLNSYCSLVFCFFFFPVEKKHCKCCSFRSVTPGLCCDFVTPCPSVIPVAVIKFWTKSTKEGWGKGLFGLQFHITALRKEHEQLLHHIHSQEQREMNVSLLLNFFLWYYSPGTSIYYGANLHGLLSSSIN